MHSSRDSREGEGPRESEEGTKSLVLDTLGLDIQTEMSGRYLGILVWNLGADQS